MTNLCLAPELFDRGGMCFAGALVNESDASVNLLQGHLYLFGKSYTMHEPNSSNNATRTFFGSPHNAGSSEVKDWLTDSTMERTFPAKGNMFAAFGYGSVAFFLCLLILHEVFVCVSNHIMWDRRSRFLVQVVFIMYHVSANTDIAALIPNSYDLAVSMGHGSTMSGILLGIVWFAMMLSPCVAQLSKSFSQPAIRSVFILSMIIMSVLDLAFSSLLSSKFARDPITMALLVGLRCTWGVGNALVIILSSIVINRVMPPKERVVYGIAQVAATCGGLCLGPVLSSTASRLLGSNVMVNIGMRSAAPVYIMAAVFALSALCWAVVVPLEFDSLSSEQQRLDKPEILEAGAPAQSDESNEMTSACRKRVFCMAVIYQFERAVTTNAIEVATAMLLEVEYGWTVDGIGFGLGCVFLTTVVSCLLLFMIQQFCIAQITSLLTLPSLLAALATTLFFDVGVGCYEVRALQLLVADGFIYSISFITSGIVDGLANNAAVAGTPYSIETYAAIRQPVAGLGRLLGAIGARWLIASGGRNVYAIAQLILVGASCVSCFQIASSLNGQLHGGLEKKSMKAQTN